MGLAATRVPGLQRRQARERSEWARVRLLGNMPAAVLLARVIPGLRLVTYTAAGFLRVPLAPFCAWVVLAVTIWTVGLYALSAAVGEALASRWGLPAPVAVALPIVALAVAFPLARAIRTFNRQLSRPLPRRRSQGQTP
jgi:membrane protein DedA with SNARE-associated domain